MHFRHMFSSSDLLPSFCSAKQTSTDITRVQTLDLFSNGRTRRKEVIALTRI